MDVTPGPVVVAVGPSGSHTALRYAASEARRRRLQLHVVHAQAGAVGGSGHAPELLAAALRDAGALVDGEIAVTGELVTGGTVAAVATAARDASLVVVGRRSGPPTHPYARSVTGGLGGRLLVPVVTVPDDWAVSTHAPLVVVGIDEPGRSGDVLAAALAAARSHRATLRVLSSWWRPLGAERTPLTQVTDPAHADRLEIELRGVLEPLRAAYDDVPVDVAVRSARPGEALLEESRGATLLVLGRHVSLTAAGSHLGPVARAVVREAGCPVLLAAPGQHHGVAPHAV